MSRVMIKVNILRIYAGPIRIAIRVPAMLPAMQAAARGKAVMYRTLPLKMKTNKELTMPVRLRTFAVAEDWMRPRPTK